MQIIKLVKNVVSGFGSVVFPANTEILFDDTTHTMTHPTMRNIQMELLKKNKYTVVTHNLKEKFRVRVCRISYSFADIEVEAKNLDEAKELAWNEAAYHLFTEKVVEYEAQGGFRLQQK